MDEREAARGQWVDTAGGREESHASAGREADLGGIATGSLTWLWSFCVEIGELTWRRKMILNQAEGKKEDRDGGTKGRERYNGVERLAGMKGSISLPCRTQETEKSIGFLVKRGVTVIWTIYVCNLHYKTLIMQLWGHLCLGTCRTGFHWNFPFETGEGPRGPAIPLPHLRNPKPGKQIAQETPAVWAMQLFPRLTACAGQCSLPTSAVGGKAECSSPARAACRGPCNAHGLLSRLWELWGAADCSLVRDYWDNGRKAASLVFVGCRNSIHRTIETLNTSWIRCWNAFWGPGAK